MELNANSPFGPTSIAEEHMNGLSQTNEEDEEEEDEDRHHPSSSSDGRRSKLEVNVMNNHHATESVILTTPTSPRSVTTISMSASDDMVEHENERLRDRVSDLEKRVHDQNDEITCLRATLADALRRINSLESDKGHVQVMSTSHPGVRLRRDENYNNSSSININSSITNGRSSGSLSGLRRPLSVSGAQYEFSPGGPRSSGSSMSHHESVNRRASYASNRERYGQRVLRSALYQSTGSLHSDGHSSNSMSPAPSPSPTHNQIRSKNNNNNNINVKQFSTPSQRPHQSLIPQDVHHMSTHNHISNHNNNRSSSLSGSMTNLTNSKKWNSTSDFRDHSPGPNNVQRRMPSGSLLSLRSPFGSQQNLDRSHRHGTKDAVYNPDEGSVSMYVRGRPTQLFVPSSYSEYYSLSKVSPAPPQKLKLEWVYGYRGRDARSNLYLLPTGEMIYFVAAVVVLYNSEEQTQRHYLGHTEDVKCLAVHPNKLVIATGQSSGHDRRDGRPHVRVWNSVSMLTIHILGLGDFEKSICCVSFSKADGGNLLLAVEETSDHTISLWDWQRSDRGSKITETKCSNETVVAAEFHPLEGGSIVTCGKGHVNFWQLDSTGFTLSRKTGLFDQRDKPKYVTCLAFSYTGDLLTGDSNGNISVWGRGYNAVTKALRKVHNGPIFSICVLKDGSIVTGGGKDRRIVEFDSLYRRTGMEAELPEHMGSIRTISQGKGSQLLVGSTRNSILQGTFELSFHEIVTGHVDEIWALAVHPQQSQFLTADYESRIHLWDSLSHTSIWSSDTGEQAQSACFSNDGEVLLVGMVCGKWMVIDSRTREVYGLYQDGSEAIQTVRFSPDGKLLALGSRDNVIYVYQVSDDYKKYNRLGRCMGDSRRRKTASSGALNMLGHSHFLTHLDWSADSTYIQSNSGDHELLYWNANLCRQISNPGDMRDTEWATQTCILSFNTIGVWPESIDGTDLVSASRSHNKKLLVTGDDVGKIKTFAYPVTQPKSLCHVNGGHSSQVTRLEFLSDDSRLISCGGRDTAIMQWIVSSH
ncbi:echinoderm microtubule-associated protein-like 2 isoform X9 [Lepeophtheirus salmonis]|uniref:echinoderm microtubule-associated protein-like 2 isoform X9 n=1 Tax=Lepeophtheirus salmonis TaxID=72036 RepID=UPI003AF3D5D0